MQMIFLVSLLLLSLSNGVCTVTAEAPPSSKPAVIMVPAAFHSPQSFVKVVRLLARDGYPLLDAVTLPSVGHVLGRQADTDAVKSILDSHLDAGRDVVLVGNSYGCTVIGEAVKGAPRYPPPYSLPGYSIAPDQGSHRGDRSRGRIISLIYLAGYIPSIEEVEHPESKPDLHGLNPLFNIHDSNGTVTADLDLVNHPPQQSFYNLLARKEADYWTAKLNFSSFDALNATATYIPYMGDFKVVYVVSRQDNAIPSALSSTWINQPRARFDVEHIEADHIPMLSNPKEVADLIVKHSWRWSA